MLSLNVRTLSSRLPAVLSLSFPILLLTEVRVPPTSLKTMTRLARLHSYDAIFGTPPGPSPTFSTSPGGIGLFSLLPLCLRRLHPHQLHRWDSNGRLLIGNVLMHGLNLVIVGIYGYPPSHPDAHANDELISDALAWSGAQKCCVLLTGDMNASVTNCAPLSASREFGMYRLSP